MGDGNDTKKVQFLYVYTVWALFLPLHDGFRLRLSGVSWRNWSGSADLKIGNLFKYRYEKENATNVYKTVLMYTWTWTYNFTVGNRVIEDYSETIISFQVNKIYQYLCKMTDLWKYLSKYLTRQHYSYFRALDTLIASLD